VEPFGRFNVPDRAARPFCEHAAWSDRNGNVIGQKAAGRGHEAPATRNLCVLSVAFPFAPVGLDAVGGAEQVLAQLDAALVRAGHRSIVVACAGSRPAGTLVATPRVMATITDTERRRAHAAHHRAIEDALRRWPVDLVHMHGIDFHAYLPPPGAPVLVTLHLPPEWYPSEIFRPERPNTFLHCVSAAQRARCPDGARLLPDVPNGVALDLLAARHAKRRFAMALGRICPEKGFHLALDAARRAGMPLLLAGQTFPYEAHQAYFAREIAPRLDDRRRFIGPIGPARKRRLLSAARCLLLPSLAPETSSLVAMEALACGTPVIAFPAGALPEIVEHGRTGFIVRDEQEMTEAMHAAARIDPDACRAAARERFSLEDTIERYFALYRELAARGWARTEPATTGSLEPYVVLGH
jgi:glycosyltransferase involved in cell wall biosynthesis